MKDYYTFTFNVVDDSIPKPTKHPEYNAYTLDDIVSYIEKKYGINMKKGYHKSNEINFDMYEEYESLDEKDCLIYKREKNGEERLINDEDKIELAQHFESIFDKHKDFFNEAIEDFGCYYNYLNEGEFSADTNIREIEKPDCTVYFNAYEFKNYFSGKWRSSVRADIYFSMIGGRDLMKLLYSEFNEDVLLTYWVEEEYNIYADMSSVCKNGFDFNYGDNDEETGVFLPFLRCIGCEKECKFVKEEGFIFPNENEDYDEEDEEEGV